MLILNFIFLYPHLLWGLLGVGIPIAVHLFNFRKYKTIYFSNVSFLKNIKEETNKQSRLKHLLTLITRILVIVCLVIAFAQPFIPVEKQKKINGSNNTVSVYVDNSFSMEASQKAGSLLDEAKKKAEEIIKAYKPSDKFQLLTNEFVGKDQHLLTQEEALSELNTITISASRRDLKEIVARQLDVLNKERNSNKLSYLVTDAQKNIFNQSDISIDTTVQHYIIPLENKVINNVYIDTFYFKTPYRRTGQPEELVVKVVNNGAENIENGSLKLFINEQLKSLSSYKIESNQSVLVNVNFTENVTGIKKLKVAIDDFPIVYDNTLYGAYTIADKINVCLINGTTATSYISALIANDEALNVSVFNENAIQYSQLGQQNIVILNELKHIPSGLAQELKKLLVSKGTLLIIPPSSNMDVTSYETFSSLLSIPAFGKQDSSKVKMSGVNYQHSLLKGILEKNNRTEKIDYPNVFKHYLLNKSAASSQAIVQLANGHNYIESSKSQNGTVYTWASGLNDNVSAVAKHSLFVPLMYQAILSSRPQNELYTIVGNNQKLQYKGAMPANNAEQTFHLVNKNYKFDYLISMQKSFDDVALLQTENAVNKEGIYDLTLNQQTLMAYAFNYDRKESQLEYFNIDDLQELISKNRWINFSVLQSKTNDLTHTITQLNNGINLWKYFIIMALLLLILETLLIKFLK